MDEADAVAKRQAAVEDVFRAIGRYFVRFSELVYTMRFLMSFRLTNGEENQELAELAFAGAQAQQIADSFFSMCRYDAEFDADEEEIAGTLKKAINVVITERNNFAHGDWWIDSAWVADPTVIQLIRMSPKRHKGDFADLDHWSASGIDQLTDALQDLLGHAAEFGAIALGLPQMVIRTDGPGVRVVENRAYRVKDVFTLRAGKSGRHKQTATVVREGPRAAELMRYSIASS